MRALAVAAALALRAAVVIATEPAPQDPTWTWGVVSRLDSMGPLHHLHLRTRDGLVDVVYVGELSDRICLGHDAFAEGDLDDNVLVTSQLTIGGCFKGNECRPYACYPQDKRPPECQTARYYD